MIFDWTISLGTLISVGALIVTLVVLHAKNVRRLAEIETKVQAMWAWFAAKLEQMNGR